MGATELLCTLISSPVAAPNRCIMFMIISTSVLSELTKRAASPAYKERRNLAALSRRGDRRFS
jgi:hypothetical protein